MDGLYILYMAFSPWDINQIYTFLRWLIRKNQAGAISAGDFFNAWNSEQSSYFQDLLGRFQARSNSKLGVNTGLLENQTVESKLAPFIKPPTTLTIISGVAELPDDFIYKLALRINGVDVIHVNKNQIGVVNNNVIDPPSISDNSYYYHESENNYYFMPTSVTNAILDYISHPIDVVWGYTLDGANRQQYDEATSVQPQWLQTDRIEITKRVLKSLGVSFHDNDFSQFGNSVINTGN